MARPRPAHGSSAPSLTSLRGGRSEATAEVESLCGDVRRKRWDSVNRLCFAAPAHGCCWPFTAAMTNDRRGRFRTYSRHRQVVHGRTCHRFLFRALVRFRKKNSSTISMLKTNVEESYVPT
jgi:hypothetical protein